MRVGTVDWRPGDGYSEVELPDGRVIPAAPHASPEYAAQAARLGYLDGAAMNREHDALHAALAGIFGTTSPVLLDVAAGDSRDRSLEEGLVELVACRLNDPARDGEPGGGLILHLRGLLRGGPQKLGRAPYRRRMGRRDR